MEFESVQVGILSVLPPIIAIALALYTKEVIFSLLLGIMSGTLIYSVAMGLGITGIFVTTVNLMITKVGGNAAIVIFLCMLGALVAVITRAGGSKAYGLWAAKKLKTKRSAGLVTALLGVLIFIDDYFNCLTVGTVMRPITDQHKISREKLAYLIDATAAPVCIIAPISSWAASVISYYPTETGITGMQAFVGSIPLNLYALLTIFMILWVTVKKNADFGPMAAAEARAQKHGLAPADEGNTADDELARMNVSEKGKVIDLIVPVVFLVIFTIFAMLIYGGFFDGEGKTLFEAFGDTDASSALSLGGFASLFVAFFMFVPRKLISFREFFAAITAGVKAMVPALIILTLAWTISGVCRDLLSTGPYVADVVQNSNLPVAFIPAIMFLIAAGLSFATGTSWGTFGILIPIIIAVCDIVAPYLSIVSLSSVLAGSIFGDHCSPISDTTILSSTGAGCKHIDHVATQIPYSLTVAAVSFVGYLIAGFAAQWQGGAPHHFAITIAVTLPASLALLVVTLVVLGKRSKAAEKV